MRMQKPLTHIHGEKKKEKEKHFPLTLNKKRPLMQDYKKRAMCECSHAYVHTQLLRKKKKERMKRGISMLLDMHSNKSKKERVQLHTG